MYWNEKIEWIKKNYPVEEFSVPAAHFDRKNMLRKIESRFICRPQDYYDLNNTSRYANWWENIQSTSDLTIESNPYTFLKSVIDPDQSFWIACEFQSGILIYKAKLNAILSLSSIGRTWTNIFHIIHLKYDYIISLRFEEALTKIKITGSKEFEDKIKQATTPH